VRTASLCTSKDGSKPQGSGPSISLVAPGARREREGGVGVAWRGVWIRGGALRCALMNCWRGPARQNALPRHAAWAEVCCCGPLGPTARLLAMTASGLGLLLLEGMPSDHVLVIVGPCAFFLGFLGPARALVPGLPMRLLPGTIARFLLTRIAQVAAAR
jgi:hypothetical protein